jgi:general secretion pathway protein H
MTAHTSLMSARTPARARGFTLIEIMVVVFIIGIVSAGVLLSVNLTGRDRDLEKETDRLLSLVNYAREEAELQTREYGIVVHDDGYQFVAYDTRRGVWREIYEDDILRLRKLPAGLDFKLVVDSRPVVLTPTGDVKKPDPKDLKPKTKSINDVKSMEDVTTTSGKQLGDDLKKGLSDDQKPVTPQVMIFSDGELTSFEITMEREGGVRSVTLAQDEKGQVIEKPMVETKT